MHAERTSQESRSLPAWVSLVLTVALLTLSLILMVGLVYAQTEKGLPAALEGDGVWTPLNGPIIPGGEVRALAVRPGVSGTLYAAVGIPLSGQGAKVYRTTDGAASWTTVYTPTANRIGALAVSGTLVYAAGDGDLGQDIISKSDDSGTSWTAVFTGVMDYYNEVRALVINPLTETTVYAAGYDWWHSGGMAIAAVYHTLDGGLSWTKAFTVAQGCCGATFNALAVHPITPTTIYVAGWESTAFGYGAVYHSTDDGVNWTQVYTAEEFTSLLVHPITPSIVYAGTGFGPNHVYRSIDGGATWTRVLTDVAGFRLAFDAPNTVYATSDCSAIYHSTAGGDPGTWTQVNGIEPCIRSFAVDLEPMPSALYAGVDGGGVYKSADNGAIWQTRNSGIESLVPPSDIDVDPRDLTKLLVATDGCSGGWLTTDSGDTWNQLQGYTVCAHEFAINPADPDIVYGGTAYQCSHGAVLRSDNGGLDFVPVYTASFIISDCSGLSQQIHALAIAPSMTATVYAGGSDEYPDASRAMIVRSLDDGLSWAEVFTLPGYSRVYALAIDPTDDDVVYAGGEDCHDGPCGGMIYRTTDGGDTWDQTLLTSDTVGSIVVDYRTPKVLYAATRGPYDVYKSTDGGDTWTLIRSNNPPFEQPSGYLLAMDPRLPYHIYLGGWGYIAETPDGGQTWSKWNDPINKGTPRMEPQALAVDNGTVTQTLYAGFSGVWSYNRPAPQPLRVYLPLVLKGYKP